MEALMFFSALLLLLPLFLLLLAGRRKPTLPLPPGPWGFPVIGALPLIGPEPHKGLDRLAKRYGPLMYLKIGPHGTVVASSQAVASAFFKTVDAQFANRPYLPSIDAVSYDTQDLIFAPHGPRWRLLRKICAQHLLGGRAISAWGPVRRDEVGILLRTMHDHSEAPVGIRDAVMLTIVNVIGRVALGRRVFSEEAGELQGIIRELLTGEGVFNIGDVVPALAWMDLQGVQKKARRTLERFDATISKLIADHAASAHERDEGRYDFLDLVMANLTDADGETLSETNVKGLILDLFTAGTDTSKTSIEWALAEMLANPEVMKRTQSEMEGVIGRDRRLEESDLPNLPYLQALSKETLRKHPPSPMGLPHYSHEACEVNGYYIPAKTQLLVNMWAVGRDPDVWEDPLEFKPDRFLSGVDNDSELIAFGSGRRVCAGKQMGLLMMQYTVGSLVHSFDLKLPNGEKEIDMQEKFTISLPKAVPLVLVASPRLASAAYV